MQSEIRSAAFATLESVTGVVKRNQLHQLLVDLGVLRQSVKADEVRTCILTPYGTLRLHASLVSIHTCVHAG